MIDIPRDLEATRDLERIRDLEVTQDTDDEDNDGVITDDKDLWLHQYLYATPGPMISVLDVVIDEVAWIEQRTRKRKAKDAETFRSVVDVIVSNLVRSLLLYPGGRPIVVSRDTGLRHAYDNPSLPRTTFVQTLDLLEAAGFLTQTKGISYRTRTTILHTQRLAALVSGFGVDLKCFRVSRFKPSIMVKRKTTNGPGQKATRKPVGFKATPETERIRTEVERLNAFLSKADLEFLPDGLGAVDTANDRTLTRHFVVLNDQSIRFDQVGRLSGGFWQSLKRDRRVNLRIGGEPIADLDFVSMHPRLAYLTQGKEWPPGDLYDLTGLLAGYDNGNPDHRDAVKQGFCSLLNGGRAGRAHGRPLEGLPSGTKAADLRAALKLKHPALVSIIDPPVLPKVPLGYRLMMLESTILLGALDHLMKMDVVALPSHDGIFVAQSNAQIAQEALQAASLAVVRVSLPVKLKAAPEPPQAILRPICNQLLLECA